MSYPKRHRPLPETSEKLLAIGIPFRYHTVGYLGEMMPRAIRLSMPLFSILTVLGGESIYTKASAREFEKKKKQIENEGRLLFIDRRIVDYLNEAELRAKIILFLFQNDYLDQEWKTKWIRERGK